MTRKQQARKWRVDKNRWLGRHDRWTEQARIKLQLETPGGLYWITNNSIYGKMGRMGATRFWQDP